MITANNRIRDRIEEPFTLASGSGGGWKDAEAALSVLTALMRDLQGGKR